MSKIFAPFTEEQIEALNSWQRNGKFHPFTCKNHRNISLTATADGWHCSVEKCSYAQNWAHDFMVSGIYDHEK